MIHSTAVIHPKAQIDHTAEIGPLAVIDEQVVVGPRCRVGPHVYLTGRTQVGSDNQFRAGCVIGDAPQDVRYRGEPTAVQIGDRNIFHEHVTVHRSNSVSEPTRIGSDCFLMAHCHVGHNTQVGSHVIIANGALLAGHVTIEDRVFISGNCLVHQFVRVGTLALMQGGSGISKDLPPFTIARHQNGISGLNTVGLRRAGFSSEQRLELRRLYHALFRSGPLRHALEKAVKEKWSSEGQRLIQFVTAAKRGVCADIGRPLRNSQQRMDAGENGPEF
jgi:UDP-N-acetylglucosamine acyltransferase